MEKDSPYELHWKEVFIVFGRIFGSVYFVDWAFIKNNLSEN
jgi:hypothetical protein